MNRLAQNENKLKFWLTSYEARWVLYGLKIKLDKQPSNVFSFDMFIFFFSILSQSKSKSIYNIQIQYLHTDSCVQSYEITAEYNHSFVVYANSVCVFVFPLCLTDSIDDFGCKTRQSIYYLHFIPFMSKQNGYIVCGTHILFGSGFLLFFPVFLLIRQ